MLRNAAVAVVLAAALAVGIALFPHALEPGHAESGGVDLNLLVDQGNGVAANDWFTNTPDVKIAYRGPYLRVDGGKASGYQLVSRPLPVFPHRRYALTWNQRAVVGAWGFWILDSKLHPTPIRGTALFPAAGPARDRYVFETGGLRRITLALVGRGKQHLLLRDIRLTKLH